MTEEQPERLGLAFWGDLDISTAIKYGRLAESRGFGSLWLTDHIGEGRDAFATASALVNSTKRVTVGTGVTNPYSRHPAIIATMAASLDELSKGRMIMGLGAGNPIRLTQKLGVVHVTPIAAVRECIQILDMFLRNPVFTFQGKVFQIPQIGLGFTPFRKHIPVYLAALREQMLKLAAEIADGVLFSIVSSPGFIENALKLVAEHRRRSSKRRTAIDSASLISCAVAEDSDRARDKVKPIIASVLTRPGRGEYLLERTGMDPNIVGALQKGLERNQPQRIRELIDDELVDNFSIAGTPDECRAGLKRFRDKGLKLPVLVPVSGEYQMVIEEMGSS
mgnify:FL=1